MREERQRQGRRSLFVGRLAFVLALLLVVAVAGYAFRASALRDQAAASVEHTHQVIESLAATMTRLVDAETGQRGFLLTGREEYLEPFKDARADVLTGVAKLGTLTADNPTQVMSLRMLEPIVLAKFADMESAIAVRRTKGLNEAMRLVGSEEGRALMQYARALVGHMQEEERRLLADRLGHDASAARLARVVIVAGSAMSLLAAGFAGLVVAQANRRRREAERELEEHAARLERVNGELEARNEEAEAFVYTVSHDLRQPVLAIQGMSDLLEQAVKAMDPHEARFAAERIRANATTMGGLLDDLLALSRAGHLQEAPSEQDLGSVVATVAAEVSFRLRERGGQLELPSSWPRVLYPAGDAYQVVANLVGNAVKWAGRDARQPARAAPARPPRVRLSWHDEAGMVSLVVEDNGPGVAPQHRERIFGLFRKLDPKSEGTGVGLAIVKRVAERNGGSVTVGDSELGGARFVVTLPAAAPPVVADLALVGQS